MEVLETTTLESYWGDVQKWNKRRGWTPFIETAKEIRAGFYRLGNSVLCELEAPVRGEVGVVYVRLSLGASHKSHRCARCGNPGDKWDQRVGKTIALWRALDAASAALRLEESLPKEA